VASGRPKKSKKPIFNFLKQGKETRDEVTLSLHILRLRPIQQYEKLIFFLQDLGNHRLAVSEHQIFYFIIAKQREVSF
jgi:hypothetical protein